MHSPDKYQDLVNGMSLLIMMLDLCNPAAGIGWKLSNQPQMDSQLMACK